MVYILLGTGFEEMEALTPVDLLRRAGIPVKTVGIGGKTVFGGHGIGVVADQEISEPMPDLDMIVLPGGLGGVASIRGCAAALEAVKQAHATRKLVAAICAGPTVLAELGLLQGKNATCYPGQIPNMGDAVVLPDAAVVRDGRIITGTSAGTAIPFALALIEALQGPDAAAAIAEQIVIRGIRKEKQNG